MFYGVLAKYLLFGSLVVSFMALSFVTGLNLGKDLEAAACVLTTAQAVKDERDKWAEMRNQEKVINDMGDIDFDQWLRNNGYAREPENQ